MQTVASPSLLELPNTFMPKLRPSDLDILLKKTDFSKDDIQEWYQIFLQECPDGKLDRDTVLDLLEGSENTENSRK